MQPPSAREGILTWVKKNRPELQLEFEEILEDEGLFLIASIAFQAGYEWEVKN